MSAQNAASSEMQAQARAALRGLPLAADSACVGRTHRVVHERARAMQEQRRQRRSLWLPLTIASAMLAMICYAVWTSFPQSDFSELTGLPDGSQLMVLSLWFLPVTATALFFVWFRRSRNHNEDDSL